MNYSKPSITASPISGQPMKPIIKEYKNNGVLVKEAYYYDPANGAFVRKAIISETPIEDSK